MSQVLPPPGGAPLRLPGEDRAPASAPPALGALPAPRYLAEYLTRSQHLHLGYFEQPTDSLAQAQERLIARVLKYVPRGSLVADVGCGLGGAVRVLAAYGLRVYGIDPCAASIGYARARLAGNPAQLLVCDLAEFAERARGARFDVLFLTEVLPFIRDLRGFFAQCRALLRPGGIVLVHEIVRLTPRKPAPGKAANAAVFDFHPRGELRGAADSAGFDLVAGRDVSLRVSPTLPRLQRALGERRDELVQAFAGRRPDVAREIDAYAETLREVEGGFLHQELAYESNVLRCSTRFGTDSVVLRPARERASAPARAPAVAKEPVKVVVQPPGSKR